MISSVNEIKAMTCMHRRDQNRRKKRFANAETRVKLEEENEIKQKE